MSLQVWLPLTGDLHNQGVSGATASSTNTTYDTNGKIGSCIKFNGSTSTLDITPAVYTSSVGDFSFTCWLKLNNVTTSQTLFVNRSEVNATSIAAFILSKTFYFDCGTRWTYEYSGLQANQWFHIALVRKYTNRYLYINGKLIASDNTAGTPSSTTNTTFTRVGGTQANPPGNPTNGYFNDVRFYDHALSTAEVHEIAQGLVLHYKLDDIPQNFSKNTNTNWTNVTLGQYYVTIFSYSMTDFQALTGAKNGDKFTWSLDLNATGGTKHITARVQHYNTGSDRVSVIGNPIAPNTSGRSSVTFTINTAYKQLDFMITNGDAGTATTNSTEQYKNTKIQAGDVSTAWVPTGLEEIVEDSSGYGHNGTITGTLALSSNTPRYSASNQFIAGTKIAGSGFVTSQSPTFTLSYWIHMDGGTYTKWADTVSFTGNKTFRQETNNTAGTSLGWYNYPLGTSSGTGGTTVALNTWTHLALVSDGTNFYFYKNGALYSTVALTGTAWTPNGNFTLGDASNMFMHLSDFRLYCTALSAADILSLYHTGARMDNLNNLHTFSFEEQIEEGDDYSHVSLFNGGSYDETTTGSEYITGYSTAVNPAPTSRLVTITTNKYSYIYTTKFPLNKYGSYTITIPACEIRPSSYNYTSSYWQRSGSRYTRISRSTLYGKYGYIHVYLVLYNSNYEELGSKRIKSASYSVTSSSSSSLSSNPIKLNSGTYNFTLPYDFIQYDDVAYGSLKVVMAGVNPSAGTAFSVVQVSLISSIVAPQLLKTGVFVNKQIHEQITDKVQFLFDGTFNLKQAIEV